MSPLHSAELLLAPGPRTRAANDPPVFTITEKAPTYAFNQEKTLVLVGAFSVIAKTDGSFAALV